MEIQGTLWYPFSPHVIVFLSMSLLKSFQYTIPLMNLFDVSIAHVCIPLFGLYMSVQTSLLTSFFIDIFFDISPIHHPTHHAIYESLHVFIYLFCRCVGLFWHPFPSYISFDMFPIDHLTIWIKFCVYRSLLSACRSLLVSMHVSFSQHADLFLSGCRSIIASMQVSFGDHVGVSVCWYLSVGMFWMASRMQAYVYNAVHNYTMQAYLYNAGIL